MTEAERLAGALQQQAVWEGHYGPSYLRDLLPEAAAELRRLSAQTARDEALLRQCSDALKKYQHMMFAEAGCKWGDGDAAIAALRERLEGKA